MYEHDLLHASHSHDLTTHYESSQRHSKITIDIVRIMYPGCVIGFTRKLVATMYTLLFARVNSAVQCLGAAPLP